MYSFKRCLLAIAASSTSLLIWQQSYAQVGVPSVPALSVKCRMPGGTLGGDMLIPPNGSTVNALIPDGKSRISNTNQSGETITGLEVVYTAQYDNNGKASISGTIMCDGLDPSRNVVGIKIQPFQMTDLDRPFTIENAGYVLTISKEGANAVIVSPKPQ